jgi:glycosyltransferase involved in cell wall biosynthesis
MRYGTQWLWAEFAAESGGDLAVCDYDEGFAFPRSPFRRVEYTSYLRRYRAAVYAFSAGPDVELGRPGAPESRAGLPSDVAGRVFPIPAVTPRPGRHKLAYCVFLSNAARFVDRFEAADLPFCFTLYPGGGFQLNHDRSDRDLRRVCSSPLFRGVIVTQSVTRRYLLDNNYCRPDQITFTFGGVFPLKELDAAIPPRHPYPVKKTFDVGFVAFKYSPRGTEKGYDVFIEAARRLAAVVPHARFHVVGNFTSADVPTSDLRDRMTFHGPQPTHFFPPFYSALDVILAPNKPSEDYPGSFDGFPTGCCIEAGACGVVVVCTDPLRLNGPFRSGEDMLIVPRDVGVICDAVADLANDPARLRFLSENGRRTFHRVFAEDEQLRPRHELMDRLLGKAAARAAA